MIELLKSFSLFWIIFLLFALTFIDGQYSNFACDQSRLRRCQEDIASNIQEDNPQSYSGLSSGYQSSGINEQQTKCSLIRQGLDCLIMYTPACQSSGVSDSRNSGADFIRRGRRFLERVCEQGGGGWKSSHCYSSDEVKSCERQYGSQISTIPSTSSCRNFQELRDCVIKKVRRDCRAQDLQLMGTYLIDKGEELSWSCTLNADYGNVDRSDGNIYPKDRSQSHNYFPNSRDGYNNQYQGQQYGSGGQYGSSSGQQYGSGGQYGSNSGQQYGNGGRYGSNGGQQYGNNGQYYGTSGQNGGIPLGSQYDSSQSGSIDRQLGLYPTTDSCLERAGYFVRSCEDTLVQRQRDAREGRSSHDVQRRICCALFFYRDCISRVVVDRCRDPSPTVVDILMGSRKRDLTVTCREYSRDQCSGSLTIKASIFVFFSIFVSICFFKLELNV